MNVYLAGPMSGVPEFNFPAFLAKAAELRGKGYNVFCPAERDLERDRIKGTTTVNATGNVEEALANGFSLREAMKDDLDWICEYADGIYMMKGWERSSGAKTEWTLAQCLRLETMYE